MTRFSAICLLAISYSAASALGQVVETPDAGGFLLGPIGAASPVPGVLSNNDPTFGLGAVDQRGYFEFDLSGLTGSFASANLVFATGAPATFGGSFTDGSIEVGAYDPGAPPVLIGSGDFDGGSPLAAGIALGPTTVPVPLSLLNVGGSETVGFEFTVAEGAAGNTADFVGTPQLLLQPVPEPTTIGLWCVLGAVLLGLQIWRRHRLTS